MRSTTTTPARARGRAGPERALDPSAQAAGDEEGPALEIEAADGEAE